MKEERERVRIKGAMYENQENWNSNVIEIGIRYLNHTILITIINMNEKIPCAYENICKDIITSMLYLLIIFVVARKRF